MTRKKNSVKKRKRGRKMLAAICNILGIGILLVCIAIALPLSLPRFMGYQAYHITSGSMEPEIPVGSVIYVKYEDPEFVPEGAVIAFFSNNTIVAHRVRENRVLEGVFITRGDANNMDDPEEVRYRDLIGVVKLHIPILGSYLAVFSSLAGKIYVLVFALCGIMFNLLATRLRRNANE